MLLNFEVQTTDTLTQVKLLYDFSKSTFEEINIDFETAISWWNIYPEGGHILLKDNELIGYLVALPLTKNSFQDLCDRKIQERELTSDMILGKNYDGCRAYWYIESIEIKEQYRNSVAVMILIEKVLSLLLERGNLAQRGQACAFSYSQQGKALLEFFGFHQYRKQNPLDPTQMTAYVRSFSQEDISNTIGYLNSLINRKSIVTT